MRVVKIFIGMAAGEGGFGGMGLTWGANANKLRPPMKAISLAISAAAMTWLLICAFTSAAISYRISIRISSRIRSALSRAASILSCISAERAIALASWMSMSRSPMYAIGGMGAIGAIGAAAGIGSGAAIGVGAAIGRGAAAGLGGVGGVCAKAYTAVANRPKIGVSVRVFFM